PAAPTSRRRVCWSNPAFCFKRRVSRWKRAVPPSSVLGPQFFSRMCEAVNTRRSPERRECGCLTSTTVFAPYDRNRGPIRQAAGGNDDRRHISARVRAQDILRPTEYRYVEIYSGIEFY